MRAVTAVQGPLESCSATACSISPYRVPTVSPVSRQSSSLTALSASANVEQLGTAATSILGQSLTDSSLSSALNAALPVRRA